jgi:hypothetical protein
MLCRRTSILLNIGFLMYTVDGGLPGVQKPENWIQDIPAIPLHPSKPMFFYFIAILD